MSHVSTGKLNVVVSPEIEVNLLSKQQWFREGRISFRECLCVITPKLFNFAEEKYAIKHLIPNFSTVAFLKHFFSISETIMMRNSIKTTKSILFFKKYLETIWSIDRYKVRFLIDQFWNILRKDISNRG